jgi:hypothetical protein
MTNEIIDFIKKQDNVFNASKYFGGMTKLLNLSKTNNELKDFIDSKSKGSLEIIGDKGVKHKFNFYILDYEVDDTYDDSGHVNLIINLIVDYPKLNEDELILIGKWVGEYCDEGELRTVTTPVGVFPTYSYYMVMVEEINGKRVPWKLGSLLDNQDNLTSDDEITKLLDKSNSKEPVTESLIRLQSLFGKTI